MTQALAYHLEKENLSSLNRRSMPESLAEKNTTIFYLPEANLTYLAFLSVNLFLENQ